jgi:thioredoxin reductase
MTHSAVHRELDQFQGMRVALIGGGQSSLQTAALLHEAGVDVRVIVRKDRIVWERPIKHEIGLFDRLKRPPVKLCEGWACVAHDYPEIFRRLPEGFREFKATTSFGPSGAWWLRDRVEGVLDITTGTPVLRAEPEGNGVRLHLGGAKPQTMDVDHVMAGTGFRIDVATLPFLGEEIKTSLVMRAGCPTVSRAGESSIDGLYFAGAHTMVSYGAGVRLISRTHHTAAHIARSVARRARREARPGEPDAPEGTPRSLTTTGPLSAS